VHLSRNNSGSSATTGIRAVGLLLQLQQLLKNIFRIKFGLTKEFTNRVGFVKDGA
jgi:hypothetical protein